jgi:hypothetical protein
MARVAGLDCLIGKPSALDQWGDDRITESRLFRRITRR